MLNPSATLYRIRTMLQEESGQALVEYALILVLVSIVGVALLAGIGGATVTLLSPIKDAF